MTSATLPLWDKICAECESKMQFGFLEHARSVTRADALNGVLKIECSAQAAYDFFTKPANQQWIKIVARQFEDLLRIEVSLNLPRE
ncbi:hypothetical protein JNK13_02525 [bacterium]|nr:hypothetical protein [bacterium]